jgi:hypothetical protein
MKVSKDRLKTLIKEQLDSTIKEADDTAMNAPRTVSELRSLLQNIDPGCTISLRHPEGEGCVVIFTNLSVGKDRETLTRLPVSSTEVNVMGEGKNIQNKSNLEENKMKVSKEQLKALIKEELDAVMKEAQRDKDWDDWRKEDSEHDKALRGIRKQDLSDKQKAAKGQKTNPVSQKERIPGGKGGDEAVAATHHGKTIAPLKRESKALEESETELEEGQEELEETVEVQEEAVEKIEEKKEEPKDKDKMEEGEDKQMEQIAESFRRFTKILKG